MLATGTRIMLGADDKVGAPVGALEGVWLGNCEGSKL